MDRPAAPTAEDIASPSWVPRRRITVADFYRMAEVGIIGERDRIELIEGELIEMSPVGAPHINSINALTHLLVRGADGRAIVSIQNPVRLSARTQPQPDIALIRPDSPNYRKTPPLAEDVFLLIEIAAASLRYDVGVKAGLYARHGIPEYWVVDLEARCVLLHREPSQLGYAQRREAKADEVLEPLLLPGLRVAVAEMLK
jgi:Uma2 family endonuclease